MYYNLIYQWNMFCWLFKNLFLQALLKLTAGFLKREFQATPDFQNEDGVELK